MSLAESQTETEVEYPETDGQPMGETDVHIGWMFRLRDMLKYRYRGQRAYVGCDLLVYYAEGKPSQFAVPDIFVVKNSDPDPRRVYKVWEEGQPPHAVIEVTSRGTRRSDEIFKPKTYLEIGVAEYFLYDPTSEYLRPPLQGHRLAGDHYGPIEPDAQGRLLCEQLGVWLVLEDGDLVLYDVESGQRLRTEGEAEREAREAAEEREKAERAAREAEHKARVAAEEELRKLREQIGRLE